MAKDLSDGKPRQDHVAEVPAPAVLRGHIDRNAGHRRIAGEQARELGKLILATAAQ